MPAKLFICILNVVICQDLQVVNLPCIIRNVVCVFNDADNDRSNQDQSSIISSNENFSRLKKKPTCTRKTKYKNLPSKRYEEKRFEIECITTRKKMKGKKNTSNE